MIYKIQWEKLCSPAHLVWRVYHILLNLRRFLQRQLAFKTQTWPRLVSKIMSSFNGLYRAWGLCLISQFVSREEFRRTISITFFSMERNRRDSVFSRVMFVLSELCVRTVLKTGLILGFSVRVPTPNNKLFQSDILPVLKLDAKLAWYKIIRFYWNNPTSSNLLYFCWFLTTSMIVWK